MLRLFGRITPGRSVPVPSPLDRLISLWLAYARIEGATAILIGMPGRLPASVGGVNEAAFRRRLVDRLDPGGR